MTTALSDATIFTGEAFVEGHALLLKDGKIFDIVPHSKIPSGVALTSCPGEILAPGFIDAQVNGGGNVLFNNTPTAAACINIARAHQKYGTTRLLPTCISDTAAVTRQAVAAVREAMKNCKNILGIHIEGPHLSLERRGVHKVDRIRPLSEDDLKLYRAEKNEVMLMTVAPENVSPDQIKTLCHQGVIVSLGHTFAPPDQIRSALSAGATGFTHLFNAMGKPSEGGTTPADTALTDKASWCGIIIDGFHVTKGMLQLALHARAPGKIFLVSDAMPPAACEHPEPFLLYGEKIHVKNGRCTDKDGTLAGSAITLSDAVRICVTEFGVEMKEALRMASTYPADFLGLGEQFGKLLPGFEADIVALRPDFKVQRSWVHGQPSPKA